MVEFWVFGVLLLASFVVFFGFVFPEGSLFFLFLRGNYGIQFVLSLCTTGYKDLHSGS